MFVEASILLYLGILIYALGSSLQVKTFENNEKNISGNIVKLKLEQNIKSLLYNHLIYICSEEENFGQLYENHAR